MRYVQKHADIHSGSLRQTEDFHTKYPGATHEMYSGCDVISNYSVTLTHIHSIILDENAYTLRIHTDIHSGSLLIRTPLRQKTVLLLQGSKFMQEWYSTWGGKVSCLVRCPQFRGVPIERGFTVYR